MRKRSKAVSARSDELRAEYRFDYSRARANPYAARLQGKTLAVALDEEVAAAFPTSESVNAALRAVIVERRSMLKSPGANKRADKRRRRSTQAGKSRR
jgi:hypothetical protein